MLHYLDLIPALSLKNHVTKASISSYLKDMLAVSLFFGGHRGESIWKVLMLVPDIQ